MSPHRYTAPVPEAPEPIDQVAYPQRDPGPWLFVLIAVALVACAAAIVAWAPGSTAAKAYPVAAPTPLNPAPLQPASWSAEDVLAAVRLQAFKEGYRAAKEAQGCAPDAAALGVPVEQQGGAS
ncbi:MAG: hypothetical protein KIS62_01370 [Ramlibacter sp.]|nr:hypothetical protein [Ramlibacter sp.]